MMISQGAKANKNGKIFEDMCIPLFENHDFEIFSFRDFRDLQRRGTLPRRFVVKNMPYETIYHHRGVTEFVIFDGDRRIRVENKYQQSPGSVDEKYPYTLLNAIEAYPEEEVIIVVDGGGYKEGARQWLVDKVEENWLDFRDVKDIEIMTIMEFTQWVNNNF